MLEAHKSASGTASGVGVVVGQVLVKGFEEAFSLDEVYLLRVRGGREEGKRGGGATRRRNSRDGSGLDMQNLGRAGVKLRVEKGKVTIRFRNRGDELMETRKAPPTLFCLFHSVTHPPSLACARFLPHSLPLNPSRSRRISVSCSTANLSLPFPSSSISCLL